MKYSVRKANMLAKLWYIFVKDFKILVRSKVSALVFFLGPLVITLMVSMAFNTSSLYNVRIAAYSDAYSPMSDSIISNLSGSEYSVIKVGSLNECVESVKFNDFQVCIVFAPNMVPSNSAANSIQIYVDNSRVNIANQLADRMSTKVDVQSSGISADIVRRILEVLDSVNREVAQRDVTVKNLGDANAGELSKLESVISDFGALDLSPSSYNQSAIADAISSLASQNVSVSVLNSSVAGMIDAYSSALARIDRARAKTGELSAGVSDVRNRLLEDKARVDSLKGSISSISASIATIKITNVDSIVRPIHISIEPLSQTKNYLAYIFPALVSVIVMFMSILMSSSAVINERKTNAYFRNFIAPTSDFLLLAGRYLTLLLVIAAEIALILLIGSFFLKGIAVLTLVLLGAILLLEATLFIFIGMFVGYLFETSESVTVAAISVSTILLFISNVVLPVEVMSGFMRYAVKFNPLVVTEGIIKKILLFGSGFVMFSDMFVMLTAFAGFFFVLTILMWQLDKRLSS